ncbi:hypothetical protein NW801_21915 [Brevibacillus laterosporus]|uniref:Uncharacterized protein n=1 Tax=Brevibacillus halotolerans TaxID=1507437 RepID=A0ABT4I3G2_9BACL|nr:MULTISPECIES: hypothetical protein [Brevibacillus]MCR8987649.1 hypothetical protein [Brevibacillus laterosporus]MCZ0833388.1 hypothetical protein [Brevibacillus halotolerans]
MTLLTVIAAVLGIIAAILSIINNWFGIWDKLLSKEKPPTNPDGDDPKVIAMPKPEEKEEETQNPVKSKAA